MQARYTVNIDEATGIVTLTFGSSFEDVAEVKTWVDDCYKKLLQQRRKTDQVSSRTETKNTKVNTLISTILSMCEPTTHGNISCSSLRRAAINNLGWNDEDLGITTFGRLMTEIINNNMLPGFSICKAKKADGIHYHGIKYKTNVKRPDAPLTIQQPATSPSIVPIPPTSLTIQPNIPPSVVSIPSFTTVIPKSAMLLNLSLSPQ